MTFLLRMYLIICGLVREIKKSYITSTAGTVCILAGVYIGVLKHDWSNASIAIASGMGLLFAKDI